MCVCVCVYGVCVCVHLCLCLCVCVRRVSDRSGQRFDKNVQDRVFKCVDVRVAVDGQQLQTTKRDSLDLANQKVSLSFPYLPAVVVTLRGCERSVYPRAAFIPLAARLGTVSHRILRSRNVHVTVSVRARYVRIYERVDPCARRRRWW